MREEEEIIKTLLVKYITGQANTEETAFIKQWIYAHPENEQYFAQLYEAWQNSLVLKPDLVNTDKAYQQFISKISDDIQPVKKAYKTWLSLAATVVLIITTTILLKNRHADTAPVNLLTAKPGNIRKITLTDGTVVWLNSGSTLKYGDDFGKTNRNVYLEGEGYFEISPIKKDIPFIVKTKNYLIRDIGTKFNLKAYPNDSFFETSVVNGEVSIEDRERKDSATNRIYIKQKQTLRIWNRNREPLDTAAAHVKGSDAKNYTEIQVTQFTPDKEVNYVGWKDNLLVFDSNTLRDIVQVLGRRYNVEINISDQQLNNIKYSGSFKDIESIDRVLDIIKQNTPISYSRSGDIITITRDK